MSLPDDFGPQPMELDSPDRIVVIAAALAEVLTCAELHALLELHMQPCEVDLVEDALALRYESFVFSLPEEGALSATACEALVAAFGRILGTRPLKDLHGRASEQCRRHMSDNHCHTL